MGDIFPRGRTAIAGLATFGVGETPGYSSMELTAKAALLAVADAGLTLPEVDGFFQELVDHPRVVRVVALSGGYNRDDANARLARNKGVIASFSRALTEGLSAQQSDDEFNTSLDKSIEGIHRASIA